MTPQNKARLVAAVALPLLALSGTPARSQATPPAAAPAIAVATLPHISITAIGHGSPVVLIPGLSSPRGVWAGIAPEIARTHRVILVQVNGFGGDAPGENLKPGLLDGIVAEVDGYLKQQKLGQADVIGHSMGGLVALMLAKAHPGAVRRIMVVDAFPFIGVIFAPGATVAMVEPQARMMRDGMAASYGTPANRDAAQMMAARMALKPESQQKVVGWMGGADPRVSAQAMYEDMTTDLRPALAGIATPITLLYPWSAALPEAQAAALYRSAYAQAPHVTFVPVADSAHFIMLDQPAAFAAAVATFLR